MTDTARKHILIVEDSTDLQSLLRTLFENEDYTVLQASNGQEALEVLHNQAQLPSLILLDIMMPIMDGLEFRSKQQQDPRLANIPVIVMTAGTTTKSQVEHLGIQHLFAKPIKDISRLIEIADQLCA